MATINGTDNPEDLIGGAEDDVLNALGGKDRLYAKGGNDTLYGGEGNDLLDGMEGADVMFGGSGNDIYRVDEAGDVVSEETVAGIDDGGLDEVHSTISYQLTAHIERLLLKGSEDINGTGNDIDNRLKANDGANVLDGMGGDDLIYGYGGNDTLIGGAGSDTLYGGIGADQFVFDLASPGEVDTIADYDSEDMIRISAAGFGLSVGAGLVETQSGSYGLASAYFALISGAGNVQGTASGHGQFLYNTTTNTLLWDADGAGTASAGTALANFNGGAAIGVSDFVAFQPAGPSVGNISIDDVTISEGNSGSKVATFTVSRTGTLGFTVDFATADGTATTSDADYVAQSGQLVFAEGQASRTIEITINGDTVFEPDESFTVNLSGATGGTIVDGQGVATIANDDAAPPEVGNISINDVSITEGDSGSSVATFTVSRTGTAAFSVNYATSDGTARVDGFDYLAAAGQLVFAAGQSSRTISVDILGDTAAEANEDFFVSLSGNTGGAIIDGTGRGVITDDDAPAAPNVLERRIASGGDDVEEKSTGSIRVNSSDLELSDDGSSSQHVGLRFTALDIPKNAIITHAYIQFRSDEVNSGVVNLTIAGEATDDATSFTTTRFDVSSRPTTTATVAWSPAAWQSVGAMGADQQTADLSSIVQEIVSRPGWTPQNDLSFIISGSGTRTADAFEGGAAFAPLLHVEWLSGNVGNTVGIDNGTPNPVIEAAGAHVDFTVSLGAIEAEDVVVTYSTLDVSAVAGEDYVGVSNGQLVIAAGALSGTIPINVIDDTLLEADETFSVILHSATLAGSGTSVVLADARGDAVIESDEAPLLPPTVIAQYSTQAWGSTDPSGLAYISTTGKLVMVDSEVEESPFNRTQNYFTLTQNGVLEGTESLFPFTDEPTGLTYNPTNGLLYISDDDDERVYWVDPSNPTVALGFFATIPLGGIDAEDVAVNPADGHIFIINGLDRRIVETDATGSQVFSSVVLPTVIEDPEALAYDANHDVFLVGGGFSANIWIVDRGGGIIDTIDELTNYRNPIGNSRVHVKDIEIAPSSDPNDAASTLSLYVADFGASHVDDGRVFEMTYPDGFFIT